MSLEELMNNTRNENYDIWLTTEESELLEKLWEETGDSYGEIVGKALRVFQKCREFIEN